MSWIFKGTLVFSFQILNVSPQWILSLNAFFSLLSISKNFHFSSIHLEVKLSRAPWEENHLCTEFIQKLVELPTLKQIKSKIFWIPTLFQNSVGCLLIYLARLWWRFYWWENKTREEPGQRSFWHLSLIALNVQGQQMLTRMGAIRQAGKQHANMSPSHLCWQCHTDRFKREESWRIWFDFTRRARITKAAWRKCYYNYKNPVSKIK